jgi:hypothetical protein
MPLKSGETTATMERGTKQLEQQTKLFPFLDMEIYWSPQGNLQFRVYPKENQVLKYFKRGSTHADACFAAIPTGLMKRLASLGTRTEKSELTTMDELYPAHAKALKKANLAPDIFPTLGEILDNH